MRRVELSRIAEAKGDTPLLVAGNTNASDFGEVLPHLDRECVQGLELTGELFVVFWISHDPPPA